MDPMSVKQTGSEATVDHQPRRLSHKRFIPWMLAPQHQMDRIAEALRQWSKEEQGGEVAKPQQYGLNRLRSHLARHDMVVDYTREHGFVLIPRDPEVDDPALPIRRPPDYLL